MMRFKADRYLPQGIIFEPCVDSKRLKGAPVLTDDASFGSLQYRKEIVG
jgi:hypothetical protein